MTAEDIEKFKDDWTSAVKRALKAGFDTIQIHAAHGYLINQFLSPTSNRRTDEYGGSFENRVRILLELVDLTRSLISEDYPLLVRLSGTDYLEYDASLEQWTVDDAARLGKLLAERGVDLVDVSAGGLDSRQQVKYGPGYQVHLGAAVKKAVEGSAMAVTTVGGISSGPEAEGYIKAGDVDAVFVGRPFLHNPNLVVTWAEQVKVDIHEPAQCECPCVFLYSQTIGVVSMSLLTGLVADGWVKGNARNRKAHH
jgi:2,4-dienoyl-CoA reductase-like NADH-dependent reductase (Old Yellow Enzyme family)